MDYNKYIKYKNKYLQLKKMIGGYETCPDEYPKNSIDFENTEIFSKIGIETKKICRTRDGVRGLKCQETSKYNPNLWSHSGWGAWIEI